jgi:2-amino-4-hydroxy-6-hydroxymethyldihydropteridine diphosphokinase
MAKVFILLGGNVGDKSKILEQTRKLIDKRIGIITQQSSVYKTESWGFKTDPFYNQAISLESQLTPFEILEQSQAIEKELGRIKLSTAYEDRKIDIDLIFYDNLNITTTQLTIPHPRIGERRFVLIPLLEIAPELCHPVTGVSLSQMLDTCQDQLSVERLG